MSRTRFGLASLAVALIAAAPAAGSSRTCYKALRASAVPVLLPQPLPPSFGAIRSITVIRAGPAGYYVGFSPIVGCAGALSCAFFHVAGSPAAVPRDRPGPHDRGVRLPDGSRAVFHAQDCSGASCMEASLTFERRNATYELDAKVTGDSLRALESAYERLRVVR